MDLWSVAWNYAGGWLTELVTSDALAGEERASESFQSPSATIVVCTRNRAFDLRRCMDSIVPQLTKDIDCIVIDNSPSDDSTAKLVSRYPVRYYREDRPGLNWARARAVRLATSELLLFTDDDVVLDRHWADQMRLPFRNPQVGCVTGAVVPLEFEHPSQTLYEQYGGFNRGFVKRQFDLSNTVAAGAGRAGAGASMAVRAGLARDMELFDCELDCGTKSCSGGDFYAFYRLIRAGYGIVYWPEALAWHRHRQTDDDLRKMLFGYGVGVYCVLLRCLLQHRDPDALLLGLRWFGQYHVRELLRSLFKRPGCRPVDLIWAEIRGAFHAPQAYRMVRKREVQLGPLASATDVAAA